MKKDTEKNISGAGITEESLETVTGGHHNDHDYFDWVRCFTPIPNSRCHIREKPDARCVHLRVETIPKTAGTEKYRYVCAKGCFDYHSKTPLH